EIVSNGMIPQPDGGMGDRLEFVDHCTYRLLQRMLEMNDITKALEMFEVRTQIGLTPRDLAVQIADASIGSFKFEPVRKLMHMTRGMKDLKSARAIYDKLLSALSRSDRVTDALLIYRQMKAFRIYPDMELAARFLEILSWDYRFARESLVLYKDLVERRK